MSGSGELERPGELAIVL